MFSKKKWQLNDKLRSFIQVVTIRMTEAEIGNSSSVVAYYLLLSMFPLLLILGGIIGMLHLNPQEILPYVKEIFPVEIYAVLEGTITRLVTGQDGSSGIMTFAAIATFWAASKGINGMQRAMNKAYGVDQRQNFVVARLFSFGIMFVIFFLMILLGIAFSLGTFVLNYFQGVFHFNAEIVELFTTLKWPVTIVVMFFFMLIVYRIVPNAKITLKQVIPGSVFATVGWIVLAQVFGRFAHHMSKSYAIYGLVGTMMVIMIWLKFAAIIIVVGGVMNAVITEINSNDGEIKERDAANSQKKSLEASQLIRDTKKLAVQLKRHRFNKHKKDKGEGTET